jgi:glycosyl transferase family 87
MISAPVSSPTRQPPYYVKALAMAIPALMLGFQISGWIFFLPGAMQGHADFRHLYVAGHMVRSGYRTSLYDYAVEKIWQNRLVSPEAIALPFNHLAYEALAFIPYSLVPYRVAYFLFLATNIALLGAALYLILPWASVLGELLFWLPAAMFFAFLPAAAALMQGQDSILLLLLLTGAVSLLRRRQEFLAGLVVGMGMFKFQIVIPIAVLFLLWRRWRFTTGVLVSSFVALLVSICLVGPSQLRTYVHELASMSIRETAADQFKFNIVPAMMPNVRGLIAACLNSASHPGRVQLLTGIASLAVLAWTAMSGQRRSPCAQLSLSILAAVLISYHLLIHDLAILLIPLALALGNYFSFPRPNVLTCWLAIVVFAAPAVIALFSVHAFVVGVPVVFLWLAETWSREPKPVLSH